MLQQYLEIGKITHAHGVMGEVKVQPWCDSPEVFAALPAVYLREGGELRPLKLQKASVFRNFVFAEFEGVDTMEAAQAMRGKTMELYREDIDDEVIFAAELIGVEVYAEGKMIEEYLSSLSRFKLCVTKIKIVNSPTSPYFFLIETK